MDHTQTAHTVNPILAMLGTLPGAAYIPPAGSGSYSLAFWEFFLNLSDETLRTRINELHIPHKKLGSTLLIKPEDMEAAIPYSKDASEEKPKPKSRRRR